jgi:hypothetical protein
MYIILNFTKVTLYARKIWAMSHGPVLKGAVMENGDEKVPSLTKKFKT